MTGPTLRLKRLVVVEQTDMIETRGETWQHGGEDGQWRGLWAVCGEEGGAGWLLGVSLRVRVEWVGHPPRRFIAEHHHHHHYHHHHYQHYQ